MTLDEFLTKNLISTASFARHICYNSTYLCYIRKDNRIAGRKLRLIIEVVTGGDVKAHSKEDWPLLTETDYQVQEVCENARHEAKERKKDFKKEIVSIKMC